MDHANFGARDVACARRCLRAGAAVDAVDAAAAAHRWNDTAVAARCWHSCNKNKQTNKACTPTGRGDVVRQGKGVRRPHFLLLCGGVSLQIA